MNYVSSESSFAEPLEPVPPDLKSDLARLSSTPPVPPMIDAIIRQRAQSYFGAQRRVRRWLRIGGAAAIAASVLVVAMARMAMFPGEQPALSRHEPAAVVAPPVVPSLSQPTAAGPADVDRNGVVNVLDAFAVARGVRDRRVDRAWDINGDGVVDNQDADRIATLAVQLEGGTQ